jgi:hypothetical protein
MVRRGFVIKTRTLFVQTCQSHCSSHRIDAQPGNRIAVDLGSRIAFGLGSSEATSNIDFFSEAAFSLVSEAALVFGLGSRISAGEAK